jgi:hypothetical protein
MKQSVSKPIRINTTRNYIIKIKYCIRNSTCSEFLDILHSSVGIATGYALDDQEGREFEFR